MFDEMLSIIIQAMGESNKSMSFGDLEEATGYDKGELVQAVNALKNIGLVVQSENAKKDDALTLNKSQLKGIQIAKAAQAGLDLNAFEHLFKIDKKEKKLALEIATQAEKIKHLEINKRKPLIHKRAYISSGKMDDTYENLMILLEASNMALYEHLELLAKKDTHLKLLLSMHQQAESSLHNYATNLK